METLPFTGTELFLIRAIEVGDHTLGLEGLWSRKGTWGSFHLQICFLLSQAPTFWWGVLIMLASSPWGILACWPLVQWFPHCWSCRESLPPKLSTLQEEYCFVLMKFILFNSHLTKGYPKCKLQKVLAISEINICIIFLQWDFVAFNRFFLFLLTW